MAESLAEDNPDHGAVYVWPQVFPSRKYIGATWAVHAVLNAVREEDRTVLGDRSDELLLWAFTASTALRQVFNANELAEASFHPAEIRPLTRVEAEVVINVGVRGRLLKIDNRSGVAFNEYSIARSGLREHLAVLWERIEDLPAIRPVEAAYQADAVALVPSQPVP